MKVTLTVVVILVVVGVGGYFWFTASRFTAQSIDPADVQKMASQVEPLEELPDAQRYVWKGHEVPEGEIHALFRTAKGDIFIQLLPDVTPVTVANFINLARRGYFDTTQFHSVRDFMIQGGDHAGSGPGGPDYYFEDEFSPDLVFDRPGLLAMAHLPEQPNTNGSQFFITRVPAPWLNGKHTIFGKVIEGQIAVDFMRQSDAIDHVRVRGAFLPLLEKYENRIAEWNASLEAKGL